MEKHVDDRLIKGLETLYVNVDEGYYSIGYPYDTPDGFPECIVGVTDDKSVLYVRNDMRDTCHPTTKPPVVEFATGCSACGQAWDFFYDVCGFKGPPRFCPRCGARVISEERD